MPENGRLIELVAEMLEEQRLTNRRLESMDKRRERLEKQQTETNVMLR